MAAPVTYVFDVVSGGIDLETTLGNDDSGIAGTFAVTINQSDCHIGTSDTVILEGASMWNTEEMIIGIKGLATVHLTPLSARFLDFAQPEAGHIGPGGVAAVESDIYVAVTAIVTGAFNTTFSTETWAGTLLPFSLTVSTSAYRSDALTANLAIEFPYEIGVADISQTITLDLIVDVIGTAHVVPDPAFGGLTALGLGAAGAWLRRRR
jgi:MYXO-CTERM domain-containing protein